MPTASLPVVKSLDEIYTSSALLEQGARWNSLQQAFQAEYGSSPAQRIARAPGRVNIIGEHIDYCGFSVLPAAIERDVLIAFSSTKSDSVAAYKSTQVFLRNVDKRYEAVQFDADLRGGGGDVVLGEKHHWSNYFKAGIKGVLTHLASVEYQMDSLSPPTNLEILITGSVPAGSGLSSSAAITTASVITVLSVLEVDVNRGDLTQVAIKCERLVGVNSGGMDQSASVFSKTESLLHVEFVPALAAVPIPLPSIPFSFVIINTLITSEKHLTAKFCYNLRVVETRLGARLLAKHLGLPVSNSIDSPTTFRSVTDAYFASLPTPVHSSENPIPPTHPANSPLPPSSSSEVYKLKIMLSLAATALGGPGMEEGLGWDGVYEQLGESAEVVQELIVGNFEVAPPNGKLKIWSRAQHAFTEARRVYEFIDLMQSTSTNLLEDMGNLMNESQTSCRDDFDCSCVEIDELCALARENGSLGSRLTGAGWGGATVHLVPESSSKSFIAAIKAGYFAKRFPKLTEAELDDVCFATKPERGACLFENSD